MAPTIQRAALFPPTRHCSWYSLYYCPFLSLDTIIFYSIFSTILGTITIRSLAHPSTAILAGKCNAVVISTTLDFFPPLFPDRSLFLPQTSCLKSPRWSKSVQSLFKTSDLLIIQSSQFKHRQISLFSMVCFTTHFSSCHVCLQPAH